MRRGFRTALVALCSLTAIAAIGDTTPQSLPFSQNWSNTGLITTSDDWSGVPGIIGYRGDGLTSATGVDPQTVLADGTGTPVDVNANMTSPNTFTTGGVSEFEITDPVVALQYPLRRRESLGPDRGLEPHDSVKERRRTSLRGIRRAPPLPPDV
jgi:hypothetical protein